MKKPKQKHNPYTSLIYQIEVIRHRTRKALVEEYMIFLINLYGHKFQDGEKTIKDYNHLTMMDIRNELLLRTRMMKGDTDAKIKKYKEDEQRKQDEYLRKLALLT